MKSATMSHRRPHLSFSTKRGTRPLKNGCVILQNGAVILLFGGGIREIGRWILHIGVGIAKNPRAILSWEAGKLPSQSARHLSGSPRIPPRKTAIGTHLGDHRR